MNRQHLSSALASDIPDFRLVVFSHFTLVARDKKLFCVFASNILKTDIFISVVSQTDATKGIDTPFWQRINNKILQLQQEGKLCQEPLKP